jgi:hypothetical protein
MVTGKAIKRPIISPAQAPIPSKRGRLAYLLAFKFLQISTIRSDFGRLSGDFACHYP